MINEKPNLFFHFSLKRWMREHNLHLADSCTELGYMASPEKMEDLEFSLENRAEVISRLNKIYGMDLDEKFLGVRGVGLQGLSLVDIEEERLKVQRLKEIIPKSFINSKKPLFSICGIKVPERNFFYVEYDYPDRKIKDDYSPRDFRPNIMHWVEFIPINRGYFS